MLFRSYVVKGSGTTSPASDDHANRAMSGDQVHDDEAQTVMQTLYDKTYALVGGSGGQSAPQIDGTRDHIETLPGGDVHNNAFPAILSTLQGKMSGIDPEDMIVANIAFLPTLVNKLASPFMATIRRRSGRDPLEEHVIATCRLGAAEDHNGSLIGTRKPTVVKMDPSGRGYLGGSLGLQYMVPRALVV